MRFAAQESAVFGQMVAAFGLIPGGGVAQFPTRLMGRGRALEAMLSALDYDAEIAERYGWINRAIPADSLGDFVASLAHALHSVALLVTLRTPPDSSPSFCFRPAPGW